MTDQQPEPRRGDVDEREGQDDEPGERQTGRAPRDRQIKSPRRDR